MLVTVVNVIQSAPDPSEGTPARSHAPVLAPLLGLRSGCRRSRVGSRQPQIIAAQIDPNAREQIAVTFSPATGTAVLTATAWRIELSTKTAIRDVAVQRVGIRTCSKMRL